MWLVLVFGSSCLGEVMQALTEQLRKCVKELVGEHSIFGTWRTCNLSDMTLAELADVPHHLWAWEGDGLWLSRTTPAQQLPPLGVLVHIADDANAGKKVVMHARRLAILAGVLLAFFHDQDDEANPLKGCCRGFFRFTQWDTKQAKDLLVNQKTLGIMDLMCSLSIKGANQTDEIS